MGVGEKKKRKKGRPLNKAPKVFFPPLFFFAPIKKKIKWVLEKKKGI